MDTTDSAQQVWIFIKETDQWHHKPLFLALLDLLRHEGIAGATVIRGIAGFGAHSMLHTTRLLELSTDLPIVLEIVESDERLPALTAILDEMVVEGLVTIEKVRVLKYAARPQS